MREVTDLTNATDGTAKPRVLMYTTTWCGDCRMAKRYFQQQGVEYDEIDIDDVPEAAAKVMQLARGNRTVPTMIIGDTVVVDWDRKAVEAALTKAGLA